ncbi:transcription factor SPT20 homolog [Drosophila gunungcola]|uniref:transcription factor SPT20 homolog n=1 Tax=Drosophila gunungcola TaxID=103775 RepID=UPI0022E5E878|nr:transcription factor SPT20 homolog [Drosophila gunungcola]
MAWLGSDGIGRRSPPKLYSYKYHHFQLFRHQTLHSQTSNKMKTFCLTLALCACLAAADVSHLQPSSSYLPPPRPEHAVSMSIEQQELRELPEQVEYMRPNEQGQMEAMPSSLLTPPAPADQEEAMPSTRYLPPAPAPAAVPVPVPAQMDAEPMMMPQMEMMAPEEAVMEKLQQQPQPASRYLPPAPVSQEQLTYQQYQEQMQQMQQMQQLQQMQEQQQQQEQEPQQFQDQPAEEQQMPYILDVQQPMAPSDAETQEQLEPEPAHELRADGYHYKQAEEQRRLRH